MSRLLLALLVGCAGDYEPRKLPELHIRCVYQGCSQKRAEEMCAEGLKQLSMTREPHNVEVAVYQCRKLRS